MREANVENVERLYLNLEKEGEIQDEYFLLPEKGIIIIGRDPRCELYLDDIQLSRKHCQLKISTSKRFLEITDLDSINGVMINSKLTMKANLHPGDTLQIGRLVFRLVALPEPPETYTVFARSPDGLRSPVVIEKKLIPEIIEPSSEITYIEAFFDTDPRECDPDLFGRIFQQASNGMRIRHDAMIRERLEIDQRLRVISMVITDPEMRKEYTHLTMPKMLPDLKSRPKEK